MRYRLTFDRPASQAYSALFSHSTVDFAAVSAAIFDLMDTQRPAGTLATDVAAHLIVGDYRVVYVVSDERHEVRIVNIRPRRTPL